MFMIRALTGMLSSDESFAVQLEKGRPPSREKDQYSRLQLSSAAQAATVKAITTHSVAVMVNLVSCTHHALTGPEVVLLPVLTAPQG